VIYDQRTELMGAEDISETIKNSQADVMNMVINNYIPPQSLEEQWRIPELEQYLAQDFSLSLPMQQWLKEDEHLHEETLRQKILDALYAIYAEKESKIGTRELRQLEKSVMLQQLDFLWKEHLSQMDHLRQGIHLRGYAQKNPKQEYKREAFNLFTEMLDNLKYQVVQVLSNIRIQTPEEIEILEALRQQEAQKPLQLFHPALETPFKAGRNEPCPCGSGKKFKQCHGQLTLS
jgi:preprotein translocase subunit SecA